MGVRNIMEYSIFTSVDYMLEAFESIDRIDVSLTRDNKIATIYLNNRYCDYDITMEILRNYSMMKNINIYTLSDNFLNKGRSNTSPTF